MPANADKKPFGELAAAWLFVIVVFSAVASALAPSAPLWIAGMLAWCACLLLRRRWSRRQEWVVVSLVIVGLIGIAWGTTSGKNNLIRAALAQNIPLIGMLIAVSFLQLITSAGAAGESLATGRKALAQTLAGVHLFGAVINFSAVAIFADRLSAYRKLSLEQAMGLSQAFIIGALWSPFYGAMAAALTVAPEASLAKLIAIGLPLTLVALLIIFGMLSSPRYRNASDFVGYPVRFEALWVPAVLAVCVLLAHEFEPSWPVMAIVAALAPLVTIVTLLARNASQTGRELTRLIHNRLPEMQGEISLFLAAGVLSAGMTGMIAASGLSLPFSRFGGVEASIVLVITNIFAWIGFHPVIMVSVLGPWILPLNPDHTLLAMMFLMNWGVGLLACPMSNTLLALHGRYDIPFGTLLARNRVFAMWMTLLCIAVVNLYASRV